MDVGSYDSLYKRIKDSLMCSNDSSTKSFVSSHFSSALLECKSCICKALESATKLLNETNVPVKNLRDYIENAITVLQMLSDFIKNVLETAAMACCNMKLFPTTTGSIILTVFMHCKDSEWVYGQHLKSVETQLKDLFRTCHELQLTYLMTLEKHFIFDLTETEEQEILIEALNINMKIGEIVQALDIKTMAEQWKAYTVICEKYSNFLLDKYIYNKCTELFANIIMENIKTAMESEDEDKSIVRSLKVANFTIKILSKVSNVFRHAVTNDYERVLELMRYMYMHNPAYLEVSADKRQQFIKLVMTNILSPTDGLCNILVQDERFLDFVYKTDVKTLETDAFFGHIMLIISIIKVILLKKEDQVLHLDKRKLTDCIYRILPLGHCWFNMGCKFQSEDGRGGERYFGLYEYLLVHTVAFAITFTSEHYTVLERHMFEAIMSTDCYSAMFSSNLWVLLLRIRNDHLTSSTLSSLVNIYQKLEKHKSFHNSPQEIHLSHLIGKLFEESSSEDKKMISKQIQPLNPLWAIFKVSNLPDPLRMNVQAEVFENFNIRFHEFESQDLTDRNMDNLIKVMKITATCTFIENCDVIEQNVVKLWSKICHKSSNIHSEDFDTEAVWYFEYLEALVSLTDCIAHKLNSSSLGKILHNISTVLYMCNTEITFLLLDLFCKLIFNRIEDENQDVIDKIAKETIEALQLEACIRPYLLTVLARHKYHENFHEIISANFEDESLRKELNSNYVKSSEWKQQLISEAKFKFIHKCRNNDHCREREYPIPKTKSNFDLGDFLFDDEFEEPSSKKAKLDIETVSIIESLEHNTSLLGKVDHTVLYNYKRRIANVIEKLRNIVS